jgi:hypothetical protein
VKAVDMFVGVPRSQNATKMGAMLRKLVWLGRCPLYDQAKTLQITFHHQIQPSTPLFNSWWPFCRSMSEAKLEVATRANVRAVGHHKAQITGTMIIKAARQNFNYGFFEISSYQHHCNWRIGKGITSSPVILILSQGSKNLD